MQHSWSPLAPFQDNTSRPEMTDCRFGSIWLGKAGHKAQSSYHVQVSRLGMMLCFFRLPEPHSLAITSSSLASGKTTMLKQHDCVQVLQHLAGQGGAPGTVQVPCATIKAWYEALFDQTSKATQHSHYQLTSLALVSFWQDNNAS